MDRMIFHSARLKSDAKKAFEMFTVNEHLEKWLTEVADVEPKVGGKYELFWNPKDRENDSIKGCKILAIQTNKFLRFDWKGPTQFKHFMNERRPLTIVVVFFVPHGEDPSPHTAHKMEKHERVGRSQTMVRQILDYGFSRATKAHKQKIKRKKSANLRRIPMVELFRQVLLSV